MKEEDGTEESFHEDGSGTPPPKAETSLGLGTPVDGSPPPDDQSESAVAEEEQGCAEEEETLAEQAADDDDAYSDDESDEADDEEEEEEEDEEEEAEEGGGGAGGGHNDENVPNREGLDSAEKTAVFSKALKFSQQLMDGSNKTIVCANKQKLSFYGLFKQAAKGDCTQARPNPTADGQVALAKWEAWEGNIGIDKLQAMTLFVEQLDAVAPGWDEAEEA
jgi:acyl-CoA-binding protein